MNWEKHIIRFLDGFILSIAIAMSLLLLLLLLLIIVEHPISILIIVLFTIVFYGTGYLFGHDHIYNW